MPKWRVLKGRILVLYTIAQENKQKPNQNKKPLENLKIQPKGSPGCHCTYIKPVIFHFMNLFLWFYWLLWHNPTYSWIYLMGENKRPSGKRKDQARESKVLETRLPGKKRTKVYIRPHLSGWKEVPNAGNDVQRAGDPYVQHQQVEPVGGAREWVGHGGRQVDWRWAWERPRGHAGARWGSRPERAGRTHCLRIRGRILVWDLRAEVRSWHLWQGLSRQELPGSEIPGLARESWVWNPSHWNQGEGRARSEPRLSWAWISFPT